MLKGVLPRARELFGRAGSRKGELTSGVAASFGLKLVGSGFGLLTSVALARILAPEGYGVYALALSVTTLLTIPVQLGLPVLLVREVARYKQSRAWSSLRGLLRWANTGVLLLSLIFGTTGVAIAWAMAGRLHPDFPGTFSWAVVLLPLLTLKRLRGATLQGLRKVIRGQIPERLVLGPVFLVSILVGTQLTEVTPAVAMAFNCLATGVAFVVGAVILRAALPPEVSRAKPTYEVRRWATSVGAMSLMSGISIVNSQVDVVMLGGLSSAEEVGYYRVAVAAAALVILSVSVVNAVISPHMTELHHGGDRKRLQRLVTMAARVMFAAAMPFGLIFILLGGPIIGFLYGPEFLPAYLPLAILSVGQLLNAAVGPAGRLLIMTGYEGDTLRGMIVGLGVNIALNALLIPVWGAGGAAVAAGVSVITWNLILWRAVHRQLQIRSAVFG